MERLQNISGRKVADTPIQFSRFLIDRVDWTQRLVIILGQRGTGKTTMLLQKMKKSPSQSIYLSLDDIYFESNRLVYLIDSLHKMGYRHFYLDEVHRYQYWSRDLKNIYDSYSDIRIRVTGSSILEVKKGHSDLSRRASLYYLPGLSFREFLQLEYNIKTESYNLGTILNNHSQIANTARDLFAPLPFFKTYLQYGYYPFFKEGKQMFGQKLLDTVNLVSEVDIAPVVNMNYSSLRNMKKLLYVISQSVPFKPNINKLSRKLDIPRNSLLKLLDVLMQAGLLLLLKRETKGVSHLQKPEKIFLQNPNLIYPLAEGKPNVGNLRETFFYNQLQVLHSVTSPKYGDFMIDDTYIFEIGGASKTKKQIIGIPNAYIAADDIEESIGNKVPLWLFGFLY